MAYVVPIHRPSSVRHALKLSFLDPSEDALVVAKANRLEIYVQTPEGLALFHSKTVYGYVTMLERLRPASSTTDHLFVGTDRYQYFTVGWDTQTKSICTKQSYVDQADKVLRDSRERDRCHMDPSGRFMTLELYDGVVTVIPIVQSPKKTLGAKRDSASTSGETGSLGDPLQVRIEELSTRSSAFVQTTPGSRQYPRMALLWEDNMDTPQLKIRELSYMPAIASGQASAELKVVAELKAELDLGVSHLIPVSMPYGGFLILGERSISYVDSDLHDIISQPLDEDATIWTAWEKVDDHRWLLGDDYGRLYFLMIVAKNQQVELWRLDLIGTASKASTLTYLDGGLVFVGSHTGDSQVIRIKEGGLDVVQSFANIAPILDFSIMDLGRGAEGGQASEFSSGQARIVTASGAWQDGSIRSVRSGVGIEDLGTIGDLSHITDLWALSSTGETETQDTLLVTFVDETRIFKFDSEASVEEVDSFLALEFSEATLLVSNLTNHRLIQVHESGIMLVDLESGMILSQWKPPDDNTKITATSANSDRLLAVTGGSTLHVFDISNELSSILCKSFPSESQIASVTVPASPSSTCIISFWQSASVSVYDLASLQCLQTQPLGESGSVIPRSVLIANVLPDSPPTLFIAMADGTVITYSFDSSNNTLTGMNRIILGSEPVFFKLLPRDHDPGLFNVFASCEQPSLVYASEGRIIYSAINSDKTSRVCQFNSVAYPGAIAIATPEELKLAMIDKEKKTQLQTLPVGETVRCISYSPPLQMFGMGCVRRILESGAEALLSSVKIADEVTFKELDSYELNDGELIECVISTGELDRGDEGSTIHGEMFIVGTSLLEESGSGEEITKGRIILFEVNKEKRLKKVTDIGVKGACRSLAMCEGKIVAGLVKTVVIYALTPSQSHPYSLRLTKLATHRTATNPLSLSTHPATALTPATIAVADLMKSLSVLTLSPPDNSGNRGTSSEWSLVEVARHFATLWSSAVTGIGENEWLVADMEGNLIVMRRNAGGVTEDDRRRLEVVAECRLGEIINAIVPVRLPAPSGPTSREIGASLSSGTVTANGSSTTSVVARGAAAAAAAGGGGGTAGPVVVPKAFIATVEGGVYMMGSISARYQNTLMRLQAAVAERVKAPGYMPWAKYRAFKTEVREADEPYRFVDGELIEMLLGLDRRSLREVVREVGIGGGGGDIIAGADGRDDPSSKLLDEGVEELKALVEGLRRLH